ncbi:MAG: YihY/virulence factor BrkB family protein [Anaerolineae bacterium]
MSYKDIVGLIKETVDRFNEDKGARLGASLAYYTIFSIAPLLVIAVAIAGAVFGRSTAQGQVIGTIQSVVGQQGGQAIGAMVESASQPRAGGILLTLLGIVTLLLGASGVFGALQDSLNTIWGVQPRPGGGLKGMVKERFFSFTLVVGTGFLLLVSLVVTAGLAAAGKWFSDAMPGGAGVWEGVNFVFSLLVVTVLFALIFKVVPDAAIAWRDIAIGAFVTALLFTIGKFAIGLYLGRSSVTSAYGAAGSLVLVLLWIYYSAQILFLGAELTQVVANRYGTPIVPKPGAVPLTEAARAGQGIPRAPQVAEAAETGRSVEAVARTRDTERGSQTPLAVK